MSVHRELLDAFNECIDRLSLGQTLEAILSQYPPRIAAQLRPMLQTAQVAKRASILPSDEINTARERARAKILTALQDAPPLSNSAPDKKVIRFPIRGLLTAVATLGFVIIGLAVFYVRQQIPVSTETLTPPIISSTPSETPTAESSPTLTPTPSVSPSQTSTLTPAITPSATSPIGCVPTRPEGWVIYSIQSGDTLSELALNTGASLDEIQTVNCITDPRLLRVSQEIFLPRKPTLSPQATHNPPLTATPDGTGGNTGGGGGISPTDDSDDDDDDDDDDESDGDDDDE